MAVLRPRRSPRTPPAPVRVVAVGPTRLELVHALYLRDGIDVDELERRVDALIRAGIDDERLGVPVKPADAQAAVVPPAYRPLTLDRHTG